MPQRGQLTVGKIWSAEFWSIMMKMCFSFVGYDYYSFFTNLQWKPLKRVVRRFIGRRTMVLSGFSGRGQHYQYLSTEFWEQSTDARRQLDLKSSNREKRCCHSVKHLFCTSVIAFHLLCKLLPCLQIKFCWRCFGNDGKRHTHRPQQAFTLQGLKEAIIDEWEKFSQSTLSKLANSPTDCAILVLKIKKKFLSQTFCQIMFSY